jgi:hypothetical protein
MPHFLKTSKWCNLFMNNLGLMIFPLPVGKDFQLTKNYFRLLSLLHCDKLKSGKETEKKEKGGQDNVKS